MSAPTTAPDFVLPWSIGLDAEAARLHHRIRRTLIELLADATPAGWTVTDAWACMVGTTSVPLDIAVRPEGGGHRLDVPVLCIDISASARTVGNRWQHTLAGLGVDHFWNLSTTSKTLDVYVRTDDEYRHAETVTDKDWLDYSIGVVDVDVSRLLEPSDSRADTLGPRAEQESRPPANAWEVPEPEVRSGRSRRESDRAV